MTTVDHKVPDLTRYVPGERDIYNRYVSVLMDDEVSGIATTCDVSTTVPNTAVLSFLFLLLFFQYMT